MGNWASMQLSPRCMNDQLLLCIIQQVGQEHQQPTAPASAAMTSSPLGPATAVPSDQMAGAQQCTMLSHCIRIK